MSGHPIDYIDPAELGAVQGRMLGRTAVDLRRKGLSTATWQAFLAERLTEIASALSMDSVEAWHAAFAEAYEAEVDRALSLEELPVMGCA